MGLWCRVQGGRYRTCQETGDLLRDWRFSHAWWQSTTANAIEKLILSLSLNSCLPASCLCRSQYFDPRPEQEFIPVPFRSGWLNVIPKHFLGNRFWRNLGNKCVVGEILLATFDAIMLRHCHWRGAPSKSSGRGSFWFCRAQRPERGSHGAWDIAVIPTGAVHTGNAQSYGPFRGSRYNWLELVRYSVINRFCHK